jgi:hypothetical protein
MIVFDTEIERLSAVREVNNKKMIENMKKSTQENVLNGIFGQINTQYIGHHEAVAEEWPMHNNWKDK